MSYFLVTVVYTLAGITIGRMCYEFDVFQRGDIADPVEARRWETLACWITGALWVAVPAYGLWLHVSNPRDAR